MNRLLMIYLLAVNLAAFGIFGMDKSRARRGTWRISEKKLLGIAAVGGSIGAFLGMRLFRHKTRHRSFRYGIPAIMIAQAVLACCCLTWKGSFRVMP